MLEFPGQPTATSKPAPPAMFPEPDQHEAVEETVAPYPATNLVPVPDEESLQVMRGLALHLLPTLSPTDTTPSSDVV